MTLRPLLLVGIDGVLNVYGIDTCPPGYAEYIIFPDDAEPARLAVMHGQWLRELAGKFELAWASGWGFQAHRYLRPILDLDEFAFVPMPAIPFLPRDKVPAIAAYVGDRPAAWIDDVVLPEAIEWAESRTAPTLFVRTDPAVGLERSHVDQLLDWARQLGAGSCRSRQRSPCTS